MKSGNPWRVLGAVEFVETASRRRAITYRERAAHLSTMADAEPNGSLCTTLWQLSTEYAEHAESLAISGRTNGVSRPRQVGAGLVNERPHAAGDAQLLPLAHHQSGQS